MVMERSTGSCGRLLLSYATILSVCIRTALHPIHVLMGYFVKFKKPSSMFYMRWVMVSMMVGFLFVHTSMGFIYPVTSHPTQQKVPCRRID